MNAATMAALLLVTATAAAPGAGATEEAPKQGYLELATLSAWQRLTPELADAEVCNLTPAGHALWATGQLRLPDPSLAGDFNADGVDDRAIRLRHGGEDRPCEYVLLVTRTQQGWVLLHLQRIEVDEHAAGDLLWIVHQQAIGIDSGQTERFTRPATMWSNGTGGGSSAGYVIDVKLVYHTIQWNLTRQRFEYQRLAVPEKIAEPDELELLRRDGHL